MSPSVSWKSSEMPLSTSTTRNGPNRVAGGRPRISARKAADRFWSRHQTMVWFSSTVMGEIVRRAESGQTPPMRVGVLMLPTDPWPEALERARRIEALGYDHLWTYDHVSWRRYRGRTWFAAIPWLTGIAGATSRIRLGTMVSSPNMRHPVTLAQDAVTADHISGGRLIL